MALVMMIGACGQSAEPTADYKNLDMREAAHKFFERGVFKDGLWTVNVRIDSASVGALPDDSPDTRLLLRVVNERLASKPGREARFCLREGRIDTNAAPGFSENCRYDTLHFDEAGGGSSTTTCAKSETMEASTGKTTFTVADGEIRMVMHQDTMTDLGGSTKLRPRTAVITSEWKYAGDCPPGSESSTKP
ncbi:MAG: hypothetical protein LBV50_10585 [Novosphingobium sp.]|nr:hypothetical protein [Novosphingobium sp.]